MYQENDLRLQIETLDREIEESPGNPDLYLKRGRLHHNAGNFDSAMNDFTNVLEYAPNNSEALAYIELLKRIFVFRYKDLYNP